MLICTTTTEEEDHMKEEDMICGLLVDENYNGELPLDIRELLCDSMRHNRGFIEQLKEK